MNKDKLVEEYYNKLVKYFKNEGKRYGLKFKSLSSINCPIKQTLWKIISDNNQYLLTDEYLLMMAKRFVYWDDYRDELYKSLSAIASNDHKCMVREMYSHFNRLTVRWDSREKVDYIIALASDDVKKMIDKYNKVEDAIWDNYDNDNDNDKCKYDGLLLTELLKKVAATCIVDNEIDRFSEYSDTIFSDPYRCAEFLKFYDIDSTFSPSKITDFVEDYTLKELYNHFKNKAIEKRIIL